MSQHIFYLLKAREASTHNFAYTKGLLAGIAMVLILFAVIKLVV